MADTANPEAEEEPPKKKSKALLFGLIGAVLLGAGAFYGVYSGMVPLPFGSEEPKKSAAAKGSEQPDADVYDSLPTEAAFVPVEDLIISLGKDSAARHLKASFAIEVVPGQEAAILAIAPRITDVLNTYLRAVELSDLENPRAMTRLRAQMLRRVRLVSPEGSVRNVLIQQFVLN